MPFNPMIYYGLNNITIFTSVFDVIKIYFNLLFLLIETNCKNKEKSR